MPRAGRATSSCGCLSEAIEKKLGQPLVIDARGGGGGMIGAKAVASAAPDGHTLMMGATNNFVINQFMFPKTQLRSADRIRADHQGRGGAVGDVHEPVGAGEDARRIRRLCEGQSRQAQLCIAECSARRRICRSSG